MNKWGINRLIGAKMGLYGTHNYTQTPASPSMFLALSKFAQTHQNPSKEEEKSGTTTT